MFNQFIISSLFITTISVAQNDTVGESERPLIYVTCKDQMKVLDQAGCLQYNGKLSSHCSIITAPDDKPISDKVNTDRCRPGGFELYYSCSDFAVCVRSDTELKKGSEKKEPVKEATR